MLISELTHFLIRAILTIVTVEAINRITPKWLRAKYLVPVFAVIYTVLYSLAGATIPTGDAYLYYGQPETTITNYGKVIGDSIGTAAISYMLYVYFGKTLIQKLFNRFMRSVEE